MTGQQQTHVQAAADNTGGGTGAARGLSIEFQIVCIYGNLHQPFLCTSWFAEDTGLCSQQRTRYERARPDATPVYVIFRVHFLEAKRFQFLKKMPSLELHHEGQTGHQAKVRQM